MFHFTEGSGIKKRFQLSCLQRVQWWNVEATVVAYLNYPTICLEECKTRKNPPPASRKNRSSDWGSKQGSPKEKSSVSATLT
jgi:hypothetical protein